MPDPTGRPGPTSSAAATASSAPSAPTAPAELTSAAHAAAPSAPSAHRIAPQAAPAPFTTLELRAALGQFATGVTVITTTAAAGESGSRPVGLTANSFNSVSLEPPLILWSLSRRSSSLDAFLAGRHFTVNVLTAEQRLVAERFASKAADRFEGVAWRAGLGGAPVIDGAAAVFECRHHSHHEAGDHVIFIGQVERCERRLGAAPLVFHGGRFFTGLEER